MENKLLVLKRNASVDTAGIEAALKNVVDELNEVNSLAIHDDESNKKAKELVAQSRKDWKVFDDERKDFKKAILEPYEQVDAIFKKYAPLHKEAIDKLSNDGKEYEENKRVIKEQEIIDYFNSVNKHASFINYDKANIKVINSGSIASYKKQVDDFINKVNVDVEVIDSYEDKEVSNLVMVEYEKTLDLGQSQLTVKQNIQRAEELAQRRRKQEQIKEEVVEAPVVEEVKEVKEEVIETKEDLRTYVVEVELTHVQDIQFRNFLQANGIKHTINEK